ncbi:MAG TPA: bifunctional 4-hydroxy-2-oxoglutarate aldolase/2-dehydro-3-deoxy-phosphogluconate aldolase [Candidatus Atribacteria bacterium]|nr:bifunctional 4-hydroxy-2-oxoglutarate aldolase/2-dehydro-3-deoxy-phosphogluconate aldolase [Candidatus Atribacteria bacterium]
MQLKSRQEVTQFLEDSKIIAIIRAQEAQSLTEAVTALREGGINCIEVTMTTPGALKLLEEVSGKVEGVLFGAGTVLDPETARLCILSGAQFLVTPSLNFSVMEMAHRYDIPIIPGALTPTEILSAWEKGADVVKVFPAGSLGPSYIKELKGPFPQIKLCPTGGVNLDNLSTFLKAGASCAGVGGALVKNEFIREKKWEELKKLAKQFKEATQNG